jgi:hypothetical protein
VVGGAATLLVPVAPGVKQVAFSYRLPAEGMPLTVSVPTGAGLLEVLVEDPAATATGAGLAPVAPVALEGKSFRRFLAQDAPAGGSITVSAGAAQARSSARIAVPALLAVVGGGMVTALVLAGRRRPRTVPAHGGVPLGGAAPRVTDGARERLLRELAALDDDFGRREAPAPAERAAYEEERARLRAELEAKLAAPRGERAVR